MPGPYQTFEHLAALKVTLYRAILRVFGRAKEHFEISLRPADVVERLPAFGPTAGLDEVIASLGQLEIWGNLESSQDNSEVRTVEEFNRPRFLYQFTAAGEATEQALEFFDEHLLSPGELQATALRSIQETLAELQVLLSLPEIDAAKTTRALRELTDRFHQLVIRAQSFMRTVQRSIDAPTSELDRFLEHKEALLNYLERFVGELVNATFRIVQLLRAVESLPLSRALDFATDTDLADALQPDIARRATAREEWELRWQGLRRWFISDALAPSQADILRARARGAIPALLETVRRLNDQRAHRTDRATDFLTLARWFAEAPTDADLHRLWRAAFALTPARHLRVNPETLAAWEEAEAGPRTTWEEAPPYYINPRLRAIGRAAPRGPGGAVIDRSAARAQLAELAAKEEALNLAARRTLATGQLRRLADFPILTERALELLLDLLGEAGASDTRPGERVTATSEDGSLEIRLEAPARGERVRLITETGILEGPNFFLTITDLGAEKEPAHE